MNPEKIDAKKEMAISSLKNSVESNLLEDFSENYKNWKSMMEDINEIISQVSPEAILYTYDEFCIKIKEITKNTLDNVVNYNDIFLSKTQYEDVEKQSEGNKEKLNELLNNKLKENYKNNFAVVINKEQFKETIRYKLEDKFKLIESDLDTSFAFSDLIVKGNK